MWRGSKNGGGGGCQQCRIGPSMLLKPLRLRKTPIVGRERPPCAWELKMNRKIEHPNFILSNLLASFPSSSSVSNICDKLKLLTLRVRSPIFSKKGANFWFPVSPLIRYPEQIP